MPLAQNWMICFEVTLNAIIKAHKMSNEFANLPKDNLSRGAKSSEKGF